MIDWLSLKIHVKHNEIQGGKIIKIAPTGEVDFIQDLALSAVGSYDNSIRIQTIDKNVLYFSGNPAKFLQGHNIFGVDNALALAFKCLYNINKTQNLGMNINQLFNALNIAKVSRVDINRSFEAGSIERVRMMIRALEFKSKTRHGRSQMKGGTLYWGKNSKRWSIKTYSKYDELKSRKKGHYLPVEFFSDTQIKKLEQLSKTQIRIELTMRTEELNKNEITQLNQLTPARVEDLYQTYVDKIEVSEQIRLNDETLLQLKTPIRCTYMLWIEGHDLRGLMLKNTYYRHRRELLKYNIDIAIKQDIDNTLKDVIPFVQIIKATPAGIPDWAYEEGLIFNQQQLFT